MTVRDPVVGPREHDEGHGVLMCKRGRSEVLGESLLDERVAQWVAVVSSEHHLAGLWMESAHFLHRPGQLPRSFTYRGTRCSGLCGRQ
ncbi:hypothetical protein FM21_34825 [Streptomyces mutabilis]|uniref:Uncharacterized protein n=1 Tax=Streptomyces mutabilis TaxID=67332 RepID=A0A086MRD0_9ACTN|nr:hypothetical protein FM21_34825 [Streptomyces mutabilis]